MVIADDAVLFREGMASLLQQEDFDVVGQAGDPAGLLELVREHRPDLVIVDIRMPPAHTREGLDAASVIREEFPDTAIMVLSAHIEAEDATDLLSGGKRSGYLLKDRVTDVAEFAAALTAIVDGGSVVDQALVSELLAGRRSGDPLDRLSAREREVLSLMAEGRSNAGIARALWVTEGTVEKHVGNIMTKLHLPESGDDHRRVLAVLAFLSSR